MKIMCVGSYDEPFTAMYDIKRNTFAKELINETLLENTKLVAPTMALNSRDNEVVVYGGVWHPCFLTYNVRSGEWKQMVDKSTAKKVIGDYQIGNVGSDPRMVFDANNTLHVIGGSECNTHSIWDAKKMKFKKIFAFPFGCIWAHGLIYNEITDTLLLIGGDHGFGDMIFCFSFLFIPILFLSHTPTNQIKPLIFLLISASARMCVGMVVVVVSECDGKNAGI